MHLNSASGGHDDDIILPLARPMRYSGATAPPGALARDLLQGKTGAATGNLRAKKNPRGLESVGILILPGWRDRREKTAVTNATIVAVSLLLRPSASSAHAP